MKLLLLNKLSALGYFECLLFSLPWSFYYVIIELTQREMYIFFYFKLKANCDNNTNKSVE